MSITFTIKDWSAWIPALMSSDDWLAWSKSPVSFTYSKELPDNLDVKAIPPMLRRRLSRQGKAAMSVILPLFQRHGAMPVVYISRHGEVGRTLGMLTELAENELLSPTQFSLSVHNATAGLLSIQQKLKDNITAIAAGDDDVVPALLEALGQLNDGAEQVLCVFCDEPIPDLYRAQVNTPAYPFATAFVIAGGADLVLKPLAETVQAESAELSGLPQALGLTAFMVNEGNVLAMPCNGGRWEIAQL